MTYKCQDDKRINAQSVWYRLDVNCFNLQQSINQRKYLASTLKGRFSFKKKMLKGKRERERKRENAAEESGN